MLETYKVLRQPGKNMYCLSDVRISESVFICSRQEVNPAVVIQIWVYRQQAFLVLCFNRFGFCYVFSDILVNLYHLFLSPQSPGTPDRTVVEQPHFQDISGGQLYV